MRKVDAEEEKTQLSGVELLLEMKVYGSEGKQQDEFGSFQWETVSKKTTNEKGKATWKNLTVGEYRLTEMKTAEGYQLLAEPIRFQMPQTQGGEPVWSYVAEPSSMDRELKIGNGMRYDMPNCGGWEAWIYGVGFALCAAGCGVVYTGVKRRMERK